MFGNASIISASIAPDTLVRSVWSSGASADTSTVSPILLTASSTGTRAVSVDATAMPVRLNCAKPVRVTVTVYVPAGSAGAVNEPASFVTSSSDTFVPSFVTTTDAPGTAAFCGSITVPVMVDERSCADATDALHRLATRASSK